MLRAAMHAVVGAEADTPLFQIAYPSEAWLQATTVTVHAAELPPTLSMAECAEKLRGTSKRYVGNVR